MADREVTRSRKDGAGDITALCRPYAVWSPRLKRDAIADIETGAHSYFVEIRGKRVAIRVINDAVKGKYLRTDPDATAINNLDYLQDC